MQEIEGITTQRVRSLRRKHRYYVVHEMMQQSAIDPLSTEYARPTPHSLRHRRSTITFQTPSSTPGSTPNTTPYSTPLAQSSNSYPISPEVTRRHAVYSPEHTRPDSPVGGEKRDLERERQQLETSLRKEEEKQRREREREDKERDREVKEKAAETQSSESEPTPTSTPIQTPTTTSPPVGSPLGSPPPAASAEGAITASKKEGEGARAERSDSRDPLTHKRDGRRGARHVGTVMEDRSSSAQMREREKERNDKAVLDKSTGRPGRARTGLPLAGLKIGQGSLPRPQPSGIKSPRRGRHKRYVSGVFSDQTPSSAEHMPSGANKKEDKTWKKEVNNLGILDVIYSIFSEPKREKERKEGEPRLF